MAAGLGYLCVLNVLIELFYFDFHLLFGDFRVTVISFIETFVLLAGEIGVIREA